MEGFQNHKEDVELFQKKRYIDILNVSKNQVIK